MDIQLSSVRPRGLRVTTVRVPTTSGNVVETSNSNALTVKLHQRLRIRTARRGKQHYEESYEIHTMVPYKPISIAQHNLNHQRIASLQLRTYCRDNKIYVILAQEPIIGLSNRIYGFENCRQIIKGEGSGAAIIVINDKLEAQCLTDYNSDYIVAAKVGRGNTAVVLVSAYFKFNKPTKIFTEKLRPILDKHNKVVIGADVNGHSTYWYCSDINDRGKETVNLIDDYDLRVTNVRGQPNTYDRPGMGTSNIDVRLATPQMEFKVIKWKVTDVTYSDHRVITFQIRNTTELPNPSNIIRFNTKKANWGKYRS